MEELEEMIGNTYQKTNNELIIMLANQRKEQSENEKKFCLILLLVCAMLTISIMFISFLNYLNNQKWIEVFNSYEYETVVYTQDGNGTNNYNSGIMGDVENGSNNCNQEKEEEGTTSNNSY